MKRNIDFNEVQRMKQWWVWALMIGCVLLFSFGVVWQILLGLPFGDHPMSDTELIIVTLAVWALSALLLSSRLKTRIDNDGIYFSYWPFSPKTKFIAWSDIKSAQVRSYRATKEFGGWGVRHANKTALGRLGGFGFDIGISKNKCYTVSGKFGLQLILNNGKALLIGTQQAEELEQLVTRIAEKNLHDTKQPSFAVNNPNR